MIVKLSEIAEYSKGQQINGDELIADGKFDYLNGGINSSGKWNSSNVCGNTVTISEGGNSSGYVNYMEKPFWCGAHCFYLYNVKGNSKYLYYALKSQQDRIMELRSGACMPNIKKSDLGKFELNYSFDDEEQNHITAVLDKVTDLITQSKRQLELLDVLVKARFVEMFGDVKNNSKNYELIKLGNIANVCSSKRVFVEELNENGIPFFRGTEIGALAEGKQIKPELFVTKEHYEILKSATGVPDVGDLLLPSICSDGKIWLVNTNEPFYFKDGRVLWIHLLSKHINSVYLLYYLKQKITIEYNNIASGTTFAELKIFALKDLQVLLPSKDKQELFADFVEQNDKSKSQIAKSLEQLETLKKALMHKYFG